VKTGGNSRARAVPYCVFFSILKHVIRDLDDDVVSIYNFGNCYNLFSPKICTSCQSLTFLFKQKCSSTAGSFDRFLLLIG